MRHEERLLLSNDDVTKFKAGQPIMFELMGRTIIIAFDAHAPKQNGNAPVPSVPMLPAVRTSSDAARNTGLGFTVKGTPRKRAAARLRPGHKCRYCSRTFAGLTIGEYAGHVREVHADRIKQRKARERKNASAKPKQSTSAKQSASAK